MAHPPRLSDVAQRPATLRRFSELSPTPGAPDLGAGKVEVVPGRGLAVDLDLPGLFVVDATRGPTGSWHDRGMAEAVARAAAMRAPALRVHGAAAFAAASQGALLGVPVDARDEQTQAAIDSFGAVHHDGRAVDLGPGREPFRWDGLKTVGFEALLAAGGLPDVVVCAAGEAELVGLWKGWNELEDLGLLGPRRPRVVVVEQEGHSALKGALRHRATEPDATRSRLTDLGDAGGLLLSLLRHAEGSVLTVDLGTAREGARRLRQRLGLHGGLRTGAAVAGALALRREGLRQESIWLLHGESGWVDPLA